MSMDEEAVRALVRQTVARQLQQGGATPPADDRRPLAYATHVSHVRYALPESDGPCLIEPAVHCNHCGYCQSHGH
jgi:hypothetical protein